MTVSGKGGRPKTPTQLAVVRGQRKDRINTREPKPNKAGVAVPTWLAPAAVSVWDRYAPDLERAKVLTSWDVEAFACWCDAVARRGKAVEQLADEGEVVDLPVFNKNGEHTGDRRGKNPWLVVLNDADAQLQRHGARFGLTPADRASLAVGEATRESGADLLSG